LDMVKYSWIELRISGSSSTIRILVPITEYLIIKY
jgi:hypothetical protein